MLKTGAAIDWGGLMFMAAMCCMMAVWLADIWLMAAITLAVIVNTVVAAYVLLPVFPMVAITAATAGTVTVVLLSVSLLPSTSRML